MKTFNAQDTLIIIGIVVAYILFTTRLTFRLRSKNSGDFMEGSRAMPAFIVGILLMSEYIGQSRPSAPRRPLLKAVLPRHGLLLVRQSVFRYLV